MLLDVQLSTSLLYSKHKRGVVKNEWHDNSFCYNWKHTYILSLALGEKVWLQTPEYVYETKG